LFGDEERVVERVEVQCREGRRRRKHWGGHCSESK
jgi:hypothetical protein